MKLLVVAPHPFFVPRGTPFSVYYRTLVISEHGVPIDVLTYHPGDDVEIPGVRIVRIPRIRWLEPVPIGPSWKKLLLDVFMILWTIGMLAKHRYSVVHAHEEAVFWCRFLKPVFRFRLIYDMHSSLPQQLENFRFTKSRLLIGTFKALEDSCLKAADAVITICPDLRDYALKSGVLPARHLLIENSIFDDVRLAARRNFGPAQPESAVAVDFDPARPVILYAGTFEPYQGIDILIRAFGRVHRQRPEVLLVLAGGTEGQVREKREFAASLGLSDACIFTGGISKTEALRFTRSAQVLVSPRIDGTNTPLKIYEQLASGKPLIATRIWSHTQVLDDTVCFLVDPEPESLAAGLLSALSKPAEAAERARNAQALYAREYSRPVYVQKIRRLLEIVGLKPATHAGLKTAVREYWDAHIHDWAIASHAPGSREFFEEVEAYRFEKLDYLPKRVKFAGYPGKKVLDVGCGLGNDLSRFARGGAIVTGVDISPRAIDLARINFAQRGLAGTFQVMDGEALDLPDESFDVVYCHTVLHFTPQPERMVREIHRVLKSDGLAIIMTVNRKSWMNWLRRIMNVDIDHLDSPVFRHMTIDEFRDLLGPFTAVELVPERFPVPTKVHDGAKALLYNKLFVGAFNAVPKAWIRNTGHHLLAFCRKSVPGDLGELMRAP